MNKISLLVLITILIVLFTIINTFGAFPAITSAQNISEDENVTAGISPEIAKLAEEENVTGNISNKTTPGCLSTK